MTEHGRRMFTSGMARKHRHIGKRLLFTSPFAGNVYIYAYARRGLSFTASLESFQLLDAKHTIEGHDMLLLPRTLRLRQFCNLRILSYLVVVRPG
jgi:hypothetical protein